MTRAARRRPRCRRSGTPTMATRLLAADSVDIVDAGPRAAHRRGACGGPSGSSAGRCPAGASSVNALADDRIGPAGEALYYRPQDSLPQPLVVAAARPRDRRLSRPLRLRYRARTGRRFRRVAGLVAAARAAGLGAPGARAARSTAGRRPGGLGARARGAPRARSPRSRTWGDPVARVVDGELLWLLDGYVPAEAFPLAAALDWRGPPGGPGSRRRCWATVSAQSGRRPDLPPAGQRRARRRLGRRSPRAWWSRPPRCRRRCWRAAPYPVELFRVQARQLERSARQAGHAERPAPAPSSTELPRTDAGVGRRHHRVPCWRSRTSVPGERRLSALLVASHEDETDVLRLARLDSAIGAVRRASGLESRWARFPSYDALSDSIRDDGGQLERGPVRFDLGPDGVVAYQSHFARRPTAAGARVGHRRRRRPARRRAHDSRRPGATCSAPRSPRIAGTGPDHPARRGAALICCGPTRRCARSTGMPSGAPGPASAARSGCRSDSTRA